MGGLVDRAGRDEVIVAPVLPASGSGVPECYEARYEAAGTEAEAGRVRQ
ncbi:MAG TPA: hypothetical protein VER55_08860 [Ardenticatenaceae bacterium]|nr:hypothetical protein [Ardenticatenaceae bacterium]